MLPAYLSVLFGLIKLTAEGRPSADNDRLQSTCQGSSLKILQDGNIGQRLFGQRPKLDVFHIFPYLEIVSKETLWQECFHYFSIIDAFPYLRRSQGKHGETSFEPKKPTE